MRILIKKSYIINAIFFLFLSNGIYYFFYPELVHEINLYKYSKYVLFFCFLFLTIKENLRQKVGYFLLLIPFFLYYFIINSIADIVIFFNYTLPFFIFLSFKSLFKVDWKRITLLIIIISYIFGFYEILFLENHFYMYNRGLNSYRVVSIFINPNNFGIVLSILTYVVLIFFKLRLFYKGIIFILSFLMVKFSGSKTALIVYAMYTFYFLFLFIRRNYKVIYHILKNKWVSAIILFGVLFLIRKIILIQASYNTRKFDLDSLYIRFSDYFDFFSRLNGNIFFPWLNNGKNVDNIYLHILGSFGMIVLLIWLLFNFFLIYKIRKNLSFLVLLLSFLLIGLTTNFMYFWPVSYFYWGLAGIIYYRNYILNNNVI